MDKYNYKHLLDTYNELTQFAFNKGYINGIPPELEHRLEFLEIQIKEWKPPAAEELGEGKI